ncbi:hypothetical protein G7Y89_g13468 [Cudoniella acicularis]|uniref:DNA repair protein rad9 n=1 Tax=Cudoniella acicularis TaxID=354080 RepID=A0A8H4VYN5_9HELO|nr:hypothetical protein G7Y89_g13468 [Cudoniella acicularis]
MAILNFTLNPEALGKLHDALALLSVFKGRIGDPTRERDTAIERCDVSVEDEEGKTKSRFVIKIVCRHGVIKTYRLTFESVAPMHALFVKENANNNWSISSKTLREFVEHFGPGTEQLDICSEDGRVSLTSYTEKIVSGNEILKQPLRTTIAIDALEFAEFAVEEQLHIGISVKDFKSIITHAGITNTIVKALYSHPTCPMQLTYSEEGIFSEFILMTIGESRGASAAPALNASRAGSKRPAPRQSLGATSTSKMAATSDMPPPPPGAGPSRGREASHGRISRPSPPPPQPSIQVNELFVPVGEDDRRWDPVNYEDEEEMLLWDTGAEKNSATMNSSRNLQGQEAQPQLNASLANVAENQGRQPSPTQRLAPTQRMSEIKGVFDD